MSQIKVFSVDEENKEAWGSPFIKSSQTKRWKENII